MRYFIWKVSENPKSDRSWVVAHPDSQRTHKWITLHGQALISHALVLDRIALPVLQRWRTSYSKDLIIIPPHGRCFTLNPWQLRTTWVWVMAGYKIRYDGPQTSCVLGPSDQTKPNPVTFPPRNTCSLNPCKGYVTLLFTIDW